MQTGSQSRSDLSVELFFFGGHLYDVGTTIRRGYTCSTSAVVIIDYTFYAYLSHFLCIPQHWSVQVFHAREIINTCSDLVDVISTLIYSVSHVCRNLFKRLKY